MIAPLNNNPLVPPSGKVHLAFGGPDHAFMLDPQPDITPMEAVMLAEFIGLGNMAAVGTQPFQALDGMLAGWPKDALRHIKVQAKPSIILPGARLP